MNTTTPLDQLSPEMVMVLVLFIIVVGLATACHIVYMVLHYGVILFRGYKPYPPKEPENEQWLDFADVVDKEYARIYNNGQDPDVHNKFTEVVMPLLAEVEKASDAGYYSKKENQHDCD